MSHVSRRRFLQSSLAAAGAIAIGGTKSSGRVLGANDRVRVAVAGLHGRGFSHVGAYAGMKNVEIAYLVDPDSRTFAPHVKNVEGKTGVRPKTVADVREVLEDKTLDVVSVATPNHWHSLMTIWACQAGKDVYVEKPLSHNLHEGRVAVEAARKYNRVVQHGTQSRSSAQAARVVEIVRSGKLGKLLVARGLCYKRRRGIGIKELSPAPTEVNFDLWLGPASRQPHHANLVHYNWHWFWDFGNGDVGNQGVHEMDKARWAIAGATLPKSVFSFGGRFGYADQGQTPNTQVAVFDYGETQLIFEVRGLESKPYLGEMVGNTYHLEGGTIAGSQFYPRGKSKPEALPKFEVEAVRGPETGGQDGNNGHFMNFLAAVRSRKTTDLNAEILEGHYSAALCHLANTSYRLGTVVPFSPQTKAFGDNKEAFETLGRLEDHLTGGHDLNLSAMGYQVGRKLTVDAATEKIIDDDEASRLLTREYRKPFAVDKA